MFHHHFPYHAVHASSSGFWTDILPVLISSIALFVSVIAPYLIIRYEKIYALNRESKEFMRQLEIYLLEWLNVTSHNTRLVNEFLEVLNTPGAVFPRRFQFYDFPAMDFFRSYNVELVNEAYVQTRVLKGFDHHLRMVDAEYAVFRHTVVTGGGNLPTNIVDFFRKALIAMRDEYPKAIESMTDLRVKVRLLLKEANGVSALKLNKFYGFGENSRFWYKQDMQFTGEELAGERTALEKEQADAKTASK